MAESGLFKHPLTSASASAASLSAQQEARTDLDLASQKVHKSSWPLQMPSAPPLVGSGRDPEYPRKANKSPALSAPTDGKSSAPPRLPSEPRPTDSVHYQEAPYC